MRDLILREIRGLAARNSSQPPGKQAFTRATGITEGKWSGVFWARWSDALAEAGFAPNTLQGRSDSMDILLKVAGFCLQIGRLPTSPEIRLRRRSDPEFPAHSTLHSHFPTSADLIAARRKLALTDGHGDLLLLLPDESKTRESHLTTTSEGSVYLLKSGDHYKIGDT